MAQKLIVTARTDIGKKAKNVRKEGLVPVALYGPKFESTNFSTDAKVFSKVLSEAGFSQLIDVDVDGEPEKVLLKEVQKNPVTDELLHISMYVVDKNTEITADIPVQLVGLSPAQDLGIGFVVRALDAITVRCLPGKLVSHIDIDVTGLSEVGNSIAISDITLPEGMELDSSMDPTTSLAYVAGDQKEEVIEEVAAVEGEEGAEGEAAAGEEGAEGEAGEAGDSASSAGKEE